MFLRKATNKFIYLLGFVLLFSILGGCKSEDAFSVKDDSDTDKKIVSIQITPVKPAVQGEAEVGASVLVGSKQPYRAIATYSDGVTEDITKVSNWSSSEPSVASLVDAGVLKGLVSGTTVVTAEKDGMVSNEELLTVVDASIVSIQITPPESLIPRGLEQQLVAVGLLNDGATVELTGKVTWKSNNVKIAPVSDKGLVQGVDKGSVLVNAVYGDISSNDAKVTVTDAVVQGLQITPPKAQTPVGLTTSYVAKAIYSDKTTVDVTHKAVWTVSNSSLASVDKEGTVVAKLKGEVKVFARFNGKDASANLSITDAVMQKIQVTPPESSVPVGLSKQFTATATFSDGSTKKLGLADGVSWQVSDVNIATVTNGLAQGGSSGTVTVTASKGDLKGEAKLVVTDAVLQRLQVTPPNSSVPAGRDQQYTASGIYSDGTTKDVTSKVSWVSSDMNTATITLTGLAEGIAAGSVTVTATLDGHRATAQLTVTDAVLDRLQVTPPNALVSIGRSQQYTALGIYSDGTTKDVTGAVSWISSDLGTATITALGLAEGVAVGSITVKATLDGQEATAQLTVTDAVLEKLQVTPPNASVPAGRTQQYTASGVYSNGTTQDVTRFVSWVSSDTSTATITEAGLAEGVAAGSIIVKATLDGHEATAQLTVTDAVLDRLQVTPPSASVPVGRDQQYTASGIYSDGTTKDVTSSVSWVSDDANIATITATGLAEGVATGSITVKATLDGQEATAQLMVTAAVLDRLQVTPPNALVSVGRSQQYTASGIYSDGTTKDVTDAVSWVSSDTSTATITAAGLAEGVVVGSITVKATLDEQEATAQLTVTDAVLEKLQVTPPSASVPAGRTQQYTAAGIYSDGTTKNVTGAVSWISSDLATATITAAGLAEGVAAGSITVKATLDGQEATAQLTVTDAVFDRLQVTPPSASVPAGRTQQYSATAVYSDDTTKDVTSTVSWVSSDTSTATITAAGLAEGVAMGSITIKATLDGQEATAQLTVTDAVFDRLQVTPPSASVPAGRTQQYSATAVYSDDTTKDVTSTVSWVSSDVETATITAAGLAEGVATGSITVKATLDGQEATAQLTVTDAVLSSLQVTPPSASVPAGRTQQYSATAVYSDDTTKDVTGTVSWVSSDTSTATITAAGLAEGVATGSITIKATLDAQEATAQLTVTDAVLSSLQVTPPSASVPAGRTQQYSATAVYSDDTTKDVTSTVSWVSSDVETATITAAGLAEGVATGSITVKATLDGQEATAQLTVTDAVLSSLQVTPPSASVPVGRTQQYSATAVYSDDTTKDVTSSVSWVSSDTSTATITAAGLAEGVAKGSITVKATLSGQEASAQFTVTDAVLTSLQVTPPSASVPAGRTQQYTASGAYSDGTTKDVTSTVSWVSSNTGIATITAAGLAEGVVKGSITVKATLDGQEATAQLTVTDAVLDRLQVTPPDASVPVGRTQQYSASGTFSDGSTKDVTNSVSWVSSNNGVATITSAGLAQGVTRGAVTLTATLDGRQATAQLDVTMAVLDSLEVSPPTASVTEAGTQQYSASAVYSDGSKQDVTGSVSWTTSNSAVATITSSGLATGVVKGLVTVTATLDSVQGTAQLTVKGIEVESIRVTPDNVSTFTYGTYQFDAFAVYSDGKEERITDSAAWSISTDVATVDKGLVTTWNTGNDVLVIATKDGVSGSAKMNIFPASVVGIGIIAPNGSASETSVKVGDSIQLTTKLTVSPSIGGPVDVTDETSWELYSSSAGDPVSVGPTGLITGIRSGLATIRATYVLEGETYRTLINVRVL